MPKGKNKENYKNYYLRLNDTYFGGSLSKDIIVSESLKMRRKAGVCYFHSFSSGLIEPFEICLSKQYLSVYPLDLVGVLLHEMIHIKLKNNLHNFEYQKEVNNFYQDFGIIIPIIGKQLSDD